MLGELVRSVNYNPRNVTIRSERNFTLHAKGSGDKLELTIEVNESKDKKNSDSSSSSGSSQSESSSEISEASDNSNDKSGDEDNEENEEKLYEQLLK